MTTDTTTAEALARRVLEALNRGEVDDVGALVTEDFVDHGAPPWVPQGREAYVQTLRFLSAGLQLRYEVHDVVAVGDKVAIRATVHGVDAVPTSGFAPTDKPFAMSTMHLYRAEDGLLAEHWGVRDELGRLWQVGALEAPRPFALD